MLCAAVMIGALRVNTRGILGLRVAFFTINSIFDIHLSFHDIWIANTCDIRISIFGHLISVFIFAYDIHNFVLWIPVIQLLDVYYSIYGYPVFILIL